VNLSFIRILKSEDVLLSTKFPIYLLIMEFLVKQKPLFFMKLIHPLQFAVDCTIRAGKVARCEQHRGGWQNCRARVESAIANLVRGAWMGDRFLSRRDSTIVARHEVPGTAPPQKNRPVGHGMTGRRPDPRDISRRKVLRVS